MIQVYTGNGKGKTTAALGLCLRAAGAGLRVYFAQFVKKGGYSEIAGLRKLPGVTVAQFGTGRFIRTQPHEKEKAAARRGLRCVQRALKSGEFDIVILDEFNVALKLGLFDNATAVQLLEQAPKHVELVLTGRNADKAIVARADLVSEIKEIKHYYKNGTPARKGIEF